MAESKSYQLLRTSDLVSLAITTVGLREQSGANGTELVVDGPQGELIVEFPPQHIAESVIAPTESTSQARLAGPSRLHFVVDNQPIPLSTTGILAAMQRLPLTPRTQTNASTLEIPWRVLMAVGDSPTSAAGAGERTRCAHRPAPATSAGGVTELWHTRMMGSGNAYAAVYPRSTLPVESGFAETTPLSGFFDDINAAATQHPDQAMAVDQLILSGCGAWFSGAIRWNEHQPGEVDWTHRAAMARDYYVYVLKSGVLYPFGHQAAVVKIVERQFSFTNPAVAALRASFSLAITEPTREYGIAERAFPFQAVDLGPGLVSQLDQPPSTIMFWPMSFGAPVEFSVGAHVAGDIVAMQLPLLFSAGAAPDQLAAAWAQGPPGAANPGAPSADVGRFMALAMKTDTEPLEGAVQQVDSLTIGAKPVSGDAVGFHPVVTGLKVALPAVRQLLGQVGSLPATLSDELLASRPGDTPDVLLKFADYPLKFGSARAAVVAAPTMAVNRISRSLGPIVAQLPTDPAQLFPDTATLLGILPLRQLIDRIDQATGRPTITWNAGPNPSATLAWAQPLTQTVPPFTPGPSCHVSLTVQTVAGNGSPSAGPPPVITDGVVTDFTLSIPPTGALVELDFSELSFHAQSGELPSTAFSISGARLTGNLQFVQKLQESLPSVGKSAPAIEVTDTQIKATFVTAVPTPLAIGAFTLRNLLLKAAITLSFVNEPVLVEFSFASRDQPFLVSVTGFGGGGYLELAVSAGGDNGGLQRFVGAIEFGACAAMDFGVAQGEVHVFGGVVFTQVGQAIQITGYLRIGGRVRVLGLISVSVELTIAMTYVPNRLTGSAKLVITVDLTFWSTSVEIGCTKSFGGSELSRSTPGGPGPAAALTAFSAFGPEGGLTVQQALGQDAQSYPWQTYCLAFAAE